MGLAFYAHRTPYGALTATVKPRQSCLCGPITHGISYLRFLRKRELLMRSVIGSPSCPMLRTALHFVQRCLTVPTLGGHISVVIRDRSKKQMGRADAAWIVTPVQHPQPIRDWAVCQLPRHSMRLGRTTLDVDLPVILLAEGCSPRPAADKGSRAINLRPETIRQRNPFMKREYPLCTGICGESLVTLDVFDRLAFDPSKTPAVARRVLGNAPAPAPTQPLRMLGKVDHELAGDGYTSHCLLPCTRLSGPRPRSVTSTRGGTPLLYHFLEGAS